MQPSTDYSLIYFSSLLFEIYLKMQTQFLSLKPNDFDILFLFFFFCFFFISSFWLRKLFFAVTHRQNTLCKETHVARAFARQQLGATRKSKRNRCTQFCTQRTQNSIQHKRYVVDCTFWQPFECIQLVTTVNKLSIVKRWSHNFVLSVVFVWHSCLKLFFLMITFTNAKNRNLFVSLELKINVPFCFWQRSNKKRTGSNTCTYFRLTSSRRYFFYFFYVCYFFLIRVIFVKKKDTVEHRLWMPVDQPYQHTEIYMLNKFNYLSVQVMQHNHYHHNHQAQHYLGNLLVSFQLFYFVFPPNLFVLTFESVSNYM